MQIISRQEAKVRGLFRYFDGKPCKWGHLSERWTYKGNCIQCNVAWKKRNKDKRNALARKLYNPQKASARHKRWVEQNRDELNAYMRKWKQKNPEKVRAAKKKWAQKNPEKVQAGNKRWASKYPDKHLSIKHNRRARELQASGTFSASDIEVLFKRQQGKCAHAWCRKSIEATRHIDHIVPLALGGDNSRKNLQLLCKSCNHRKGAKHPIDFAQQNGLLL